jgi:hypothetical protein
MNSGIFKGLYPLPRQVQMVKNHPINTVIDEHLYIIYFPYLGMGIAHHGGVFLLVTTVFNAHTDQIMEGIGDVEHHIGDDVASLCNQALRHHTGVEVKLFNNFLDNPAGFFLYIAGLVNDPGDGHFGNPGLSGHIINRRHFSFS